MENQKNNEIVDSENFLKQKFKNDKSALNGSVFIKKAQKNFDIKFGIETYGSRLRKIELYDENNSIAPVSYIKYQVQKDGFSFAILKQTLTIKVWDLGNTFINLHKHMLTC